MHLDVELVRADRPELARLELGEPRSLQRETDASVLVGLPVADLRALHRLTAPAIDDRQLERPADARRLRSAELEELPAESIEGDQDAVVRLDLLLAAANGEVLVVQLEAPELATGRRVRPDPVDEEVLERGRPRASPGHAREPCTVVEPAGDGRARRRACAIVGPVALVGAGAVAAVHAVDGRRDVPLEERRVHALHSD